MIVFPTCKINLGLNIVAKRTDGFHDIETVFYPLSLCDILEAVKAAQTELQVTGIALDSSVNDNLVLKVYHLIARDKTLPPLHFHLHKQIPAGAGLGGGSADAAFAILLIDQLCELNLTENEKLCYARQVGSDCAFFLRNKPVFAKEKGDVFSDISLSLNDYHIHLFKPEIHVSTAEAYRGVIPNDKQTSPAQVVILPITEWKDKLHNQFEDTVCMKYPVIKDIKQWMYDHGALYAAMSGSGSTVFGIFKEPCTSRPAMKGFWF